MPQPTNEQLSRGGRYTVDELLAPGPEGAPDVPLIVCRPADSVGPVPVLYHTHGGGMIIGTARDGLLEVLDLAAQSGAAVVSVEVRLAPETPHPGPTVVVEGPAVLAGFGSAAPATEESYLDDRHTTFDGRALAVVQPTGPGTITVTASAPGFADAGVSMEAR